MLFELPSISIVTPSYNQADFLETTLVSVLNQKYPKLEYIVMDGESKDGSADIIRRYNHQLAHWQSEPDNGQAWALARGFELATGVVLGWVNSDDVLLSGSLQTVGAYFAAHPECEVLSGGAYQIDKHGQPIRAPWWRPHANFGVATDFPRLKYCGMEGIAQPSTFWRKSAYDKVGGLDPSLQFVMDLDLLLRLARRGRFHRTNEMLAAYRLHDGAKTMTIRDVLYKERRLLAERYGCADEQLLRQRFGYWRYRFPSLLTKAAIVALQPFATRIQPIPTVSA